MVDYLRRSFKSVQLYCSYNCLELDLAGHRVAVVDHGVARWAIPHIHWGNWGEMSALRVYDPGSGVRGSRGQGLTSSLRDFVTGLSTGYIQKPWNRFCG